MTAKEYKVEKIYLVVIH